MTAPADPAASAHAAKRSRHRSAPGPSPPSDPATIPAAREGEPRQDSRRRRRRRTGRGDSTGESSERVGAAAVDDDILPELVDAYDSSDSEDEDEDAPTAARKGGKQLHSQSNEAGVAGLSWQTDSFAGCFPSTIKPSAANYNLMREDYELFLKMGPRCMASSSAMAFGSPAKMEYPHAAPIPAGPIPR